MKGGFLMIYYFGMKGRIKFKYLLPVVYLALILILGWDSSWRMFLAMPGFIVAVSFLRPGYFPTWIFDWGYWLIVTFGLMIGLGLLIDFVVSKVSKVSKKRNL
jgi:hypothetical protein